MKLDNKHIEALARLSTNNDFKTLVMILRNHMNNCMVTEFKYPTSDPVANTTNKSYYQGQVDLIKLIIKTVESSKRKHGEME